MKKTKKELKKELLSRKNKTASYSDFKVRKKEYKSDVELVKKTLPGLLK